MIFQRLAAAVPLSATVEFTVLCGTLSGPCSARTRSVRKIYAPVRESRSTARTCSCSLGPSPIVPPLPAASRPLPRFAFAHPLPGHSLPRAAEPPATASHSHAAIRQSPQQFRRPAPHFRGDGGATRLASPPF